MTEAGSKIETTGGPALGYAGFRFVLGVNFFMHGPSACSVITRGL